MIDKICDVWYCDGRTGRGYTAACLGPNHDIFVSGGLRDSVAVNTIDCYDIRQGLWMNNVVDADAVIDSWSEYTDDLLVRAGHQMIHLWEK